MIEALHLITQKIVKEIIYIIHIYKATFDTLLKFFIPIVSMYARCQIHYRIRSYTTGHLFKMSCGQWWCMKGKRFINKF